MEETVLQIYSLFARASGLALNGNLLIMLGIGLSACVLGIEVACIVMLIRKLSHAKRERDDEGGAGNFAMLAFSSVSIPFAAEHILALMVALNALAALIFMILALTVRSKGFDYASARNSAELSEGLTFLMDANANRPRLLEVFTDAQEDSAILKQFYNTSKT